MIFDRKGGMQQCEERGDIQTRPQQEALYEAIDML